MRLEGKVAIVSGGAQGMGAEERRLLAREGASRNPRSSPKFRLEPSACRCSRGAAALGRTLPATRPLDTISVRPLPRRRSSRLVSTSGGPRRKCAAEPRSPAGPAHWACGGFGALLHHPPERAPIIDGSCSRHAPQCSPRSWASSIGRSPPSSCAALDAAAQSRLPHRYRTLWRVWRHVARHRMHRTPRTHREEPHPSRRAQHRLHRPPPRTAVARASHPTPGLPISDPVLTAPGGCSTAPLRLASLALRSPAPSRHAFLFAGSKSHHPDRDSSALAPMSNPTTTGPILPQPSQSTLYSSYPSARCGCGTSVTSPPWPA